MVSEVNGSVKFHQPEARFQEEIVEVEDKHKDVSRDVQENSARVVGYFVRWLR